MGDVELGSKSTNAGMGFASEAGKLIRRLNVMQASKENKEELDK